jgi:hypothetical protein
MYLSDQVLNQQIQGFKVVAERAEASKAPKPVVEQAKTMVSLLEELKERRSKNA